MEGVTSATPDAPDRQSDSEKAGDAATAPDESAQESAMDVDIDKGARGDGQTAHAPSAERIAAPQLEMPEGPAAPAKPLEGALPEPRLPGPKKERTKPRGKRPPPGEGGRRPARKVKKGIFVSYSPDGGFLERKLVCETVRQFKENDLAEDVWFDKDEGNTASPSWFSQRMDAVERCRAALCFLSHSYFQCPVSVYELRCLLERQVLPAADASSSAASSAGLSPPRVFLILCEEVEVPAHYALFLPDLVRLALPCYQRLSLAEKASVVIGALMQRLEPYASVFAAHVPRPPLAADYNDEYRAKRLGDWTPDDLQSWLYHLGVREFYRQSLAEAGLDGFLLGSVSDADLTELGVDSRAVRKKLLQQVVAILEREHKVAESWHLRARTQRSRPDCVYLVYDPADVRLAQNLKQDLKKKNLQVICHEKLGQSKEEFLSINGPLIATARYAVVLLTDGATSSPFVFNEVLFADWLGKALVTVMFKNVWSKMRPSLKAVLGEFPAIDFETKMYSESMDVLEHHIKPLRKVPGVVLEQTYLNRMSEGLKPLQVLAASQGNGLAIGNGASNAEVFLSYQWDMHNKVQEVKRILESNGISCWLDSSPTIAQNHPQQQSQHLQQQQQQLRGASGSSSRSSAPAVAESLEMRSQRRMKSSTIVLACVTPRYLQSDNGVKDLLLAEALGRPVLAVLLRFVAWPPDMGPSPVKKLLARASHIDLSNDKLFKQNFHVLVERLRRFLNTKY